MCLGRDTRQSKYAHGMTFGLPSALWDTWQMLRDPGSRYVFKCLLCVVHVAHGKTWNLSCVLFCRVFSCQAHGKHANLPCALCLPCVTSWAHDK